MNATVPAKVAGTSQSSRVPDASGTASNPMSFDPGGSITLLRILDSTPGDAVTGCGDMAANPNATHKAKAPRSTRRRPFLRATRSPPRYASNRKIAAFRCS